jgi:hypothetical protein
MDFDVGLFWKLGSYGNRNIRWIKASRSNLVKEWLKEMVVMAIDEDHPHQGSTSEGFSGLHSSKPGSDDHHNGLALVKGRS